jgi:ABC-type sugar transport system substrate-binding protein
MIRQHMIKRDTIRQNMIRRTSFVALAALLGICASAAHAEDAVKVGIIATLSGPPAVLGQQLRNGFQLAVKDLGGKLGGRDAEIVVADDELKPDVAVTKVKSLIATRSTSSSARSSPTSSAPSPSRSPRRTSS